MRWNRVSVTATLFILLSIGSAIYLTVITLNYLNYYPALQQIQVQVVSVSVVPGSNWSTIDSRITIANPTDYNGFRLGEADESMYFYTENSNATLFAVQSLRVIQIIGGQLGPHSTVASNIMIHLNSADANSLHSFNNTNNGQVRASVSLTVEVITFLDPVLGRLDYTTTGAVPLSSN